MELTKKWVLHEVIRVLVVDQDSTSLKIVSKMLSVCGYEVIAANCAIDALMIVRERENDIHLILTEVHLPDMGRYELLEKIMEQTSKLPIVIMSSDDNKIVKLGCLFKGAMLHLVKPLSMKSIRNLWQFPFIKRRERFVYIRASNRVREESINENDSNENKGDQLIRNEKTKRQSIKRKEQDEVNTKRPEGNGIDSTVKRPKLIWTQQLHNRFLQAIEVLGVDKAHPKEILQHMNVPGLRKGNISSHLQKFRLSLKHDQDAIQKKNSQSSELKDELVQIRNQQVSTNSPSLSHLLGRQLPNNDGVFMTKKPPFGQETQPQPSNNLPPTNSINSNLIESCDVVSSESLTNCNMDNSCFSKAILLNQTCSMSSTQQPLEDQEGRQSWFECKRKDMTLSTMHLLEQQQHYMFKVDEGELDGIFDIVKDFTITLHEPDYYDDLWQ